MKIQIKNYIEKIIQEASNIGLTFTKDKIIDESKNINHHTVKGFVQSKFPESSSKTIHLLIASVIYNSKTNSIIETIR